MLKQILTEHKQAVKNADSSTLPKRDTTSIWIISMGHSYTQKSNRLMKVKWSLAIYVLFSGINLDAGVYVD